MLSHVYTDKVYRNGINPNDVTFVDTLHELFVYIGPGANDNERNSVWTQADVSPRVSSLSNYYKIPYTSDLGDIFLVKILWEEFQNFLFFTLQKFLKESNMPYKSIAVFSAGCYCYGFEEIWDDLQH